MSDIPGSIRGSDLSSRQLLCDCLLVSHILFFLFPILGSILILCIADPTLEATLVHNGPKISWLSGQKKLLRAV